MSQPNLSSSDRSLRHRRQAWLVTTFALFLLLGSVELGHAVKLKDSFKKQSLSVRLVGRAAQLPVSSFGANYESYVAVVQTRKNNDPSFVKLVYRFLDYDKGLSLLFMDYGFVHRFRAVRQPDCDESADAMLYKRQVLPSGDVLSREFSFEYAKNVTGAAIPQSAALPCYVVAPGDYRDSHRSLPNPYGSALAERGSNLTPEPKLP
jgi:hypothetical protein